MDKQNKKTNELVVEGIVIPEKWDDDGKVTGVTIQTSNEDVYLVEHTRTGQELLALIHKKVEAKCKIKERLNRRTLIIVLNYREVEEEVEIGIK